MIAPVALCAFNRPELTARVFDAIRQARPPTLLLVADGPRPGHRQDEERCAQVRAVMAQVDWPCEVVTNYSPTNLGCGRRMATGIAWVFEQVDRAIILEDDCLPHPTFFRFCEELLEAYRDDERVMQICGTNLLGEWRADVRSYHFSYYGSVWGWASWRRAWRLYDASMTSWPLPAVQENVRNALADESQFQSRKRLFSIACEGKLDTWDYQWSLARLEQSGLSIVPAVNLISNLGFSTDGTHTVNSSAFGASLPTQEMRFPLTPPRGVVVDRDYDRQVFRGQTGSYRLSARARRLLGTLLGPARGRIGARLRAARRAGGEV